MKTPDTLKDFLATAPNLILGYNELAFIEPQLFEAAQEGYRFDEKGKSFITDKAGDWQDGWWVIAEDDMGDPVFVDVSSKALKVMAAPHGEGTWEPFVIADSLANLKEIIALLAELTKGRNTPDEFEQNPLSEEAQEAVLKEIARQNPGSEVWYWGNFFDNDF